MITPLISILVLVVVVFVTIAALVSRYKRCPSDKILVVYGKTGGTSAKCIHGGGAFIWPVIQDYAYLDLKPISIEANLTNALSRQNIRVDVPCRFTIAISTEIDSMNNAAERLLGLGARADPGTIQRHSLWPAEVGNSHHDHRRNQF
jgi:flotillin